jgi:hypothetical protein
LLLRSPDEAREFDKGRFELLALGGLTIGQRHTPRLEMADPRSPGRWHAQRAQASGRGRAFYPALRKLRIRLRDFYFSTRDTFISEMLRRGRT